MARCLKSGFFDMKLIKQTPRRNQLKTQLKLFFYDGKFACTVLKQLKQLWKIICHKYFVDPKFTERLPSQRVKIWSRFHFLWLVINLLSWKKALRKYFLGKKEFQNHSKNSEIPHTISRIWCFWSNSQNCGHRL